MLISHATAQPGESARPCGIDMKRKRRKAGRRGISLLFKDGSREQVKVRDGKAKNKHESVWLVCVYITTPYLACITSCCKIAVLSWDLQSRWHFGYGDANANAPSQCAAYARLPCMVRINETLRLGQARFCGLWHSLVLNFTYSTSGREGDGHEQEHVDLVCAEASAEVLVLYIIKQYYCTYVI